MWPKGPKQKVIVELPIPKKVTKKINCSGIINFKKNKKPILTTVIPN